MLLINLLYIASYYYTLTSGMSMPRPLKSTPVESELGNRYNPYAAAVKKQVCSTVFRNSGHFSIMPKNTSPKSRAIFFQCFQLAKYKTLESKTLAIQRSIRQIRQSFTPPNVYHYKVHVSYLHAATGIASYV